MFYTLKIRLKKIKKYIFKFLVRTKKHLLVNKMGFDENIDIKSNKL